MFLFIYKRVRMVFFYFFKALTRNLDKNFVNCADLHTNSHKETCILEFGHVSCHIIGVY